MKLINIIPKTEIKVKGIKGFLRKKVTKYGTGAKVDIPKRYLGEQVYIIILENGSKKESRRTGKRSKKA